MQKKPRSLRRSWPHGSPRALRPAGLILYDGLYLGKNKTSPNPGVSFEWESMEILKSSFKFELKGQQINLDVDLVVGAGAWCNNNTIIYFSFDMKCKQINPDVDLAVEAGAWCNNNTIIYFSFDVKCKQINLDVDLVVRAGAWCNKIWQVNRLLDKTHQLVGQILNYPGPEVYNLGDNYNFAPISLRMLSYFWGQGHRFQS